MPLKTLIGLAADTNTEKNINMKKDIKKYECEYNLVEEWTVCDRKSESIEAHPQHHVIRRVIAVAPAAAVKKSDHSLLAEHHTAATQRQTSGICKTDV